MELHFTPEQEAQLAQIATQEGIDAEAPGAGSCLIVMAERWGRKLLGVGAQAGF
jgi:hypothetical protein